MKNVKALSTNTREHKIVIPKVSANISIQTGNSIRLKAEEVFRLQPVKTQEGRFEQIVPSQTRKDLIISPMSAFFYPND